MLSLCLERIAIDWFLSPLRKRGGHGKSGGNFGGNFPGKKCRTACGVDFRQLFGSCTTKQARNRLKGPQANAEGLFLLSAFSVRAFPADSPSRPAQTSLGAKKRHLWSIRFGLSTTGCGHASGRQRPFCPMLCTMLCCAPKRKAATTSVGLLVSATCSTTVGETRKRRDIPLLDSACARELAQIGYVPTCERGRVAWVRFLLCSG